MPREIGLGNPLGEDDIDGDIDFDFFEEENANKDERTKDYVASTPRPPSSKTTNIEDKNFSHQLNNSSSESQNDTKSLENEVYQSKWSNSDKYEAQNGNDDEEEDDDIDDDHSDTFESESESENSLDVTVTDSSSSSDWSEDDSFESLSDSDITDVTPLSSANVSPLPASPNRFQMLKTLRQRRKEGVKFFEEKKEIHQSDNKPPVDLDLLVEAILKLEKERKNGDVVVQPRQERINSSKKNMSFSDDEVRKIDRENQLLLKKILDQQNSQKSSSNANQTRLPRPASSAINRLRQQKKIEAENLTLLKRIQSAKPTRELSRQYLLKKDQKNCGFSSDSRCLSQSSLLLKGSARKEHRSTSCTSSTTSNTSQLRNNTTIPIPIQNNMNNNKSPLNRARVRSNRASEVRIEWNARLHSKS